jgi:hypothetical protein
MMLRLSEVRKLLNLLMGQHGQYLMIGAGTLFILSLRLFLLLLMTEAGLRMGGVVRILYYLIVGMLCQVLQVLGEVINFQNHQ